MFKHLKETEKFKETVIVNSKEPIIEDRKTVAIEKIKILLDRNNILLGENVKLIEANTELLEELNIDEILLEEPNVDEDAILLEDISKQKLDLNEGDDILGIFIYRFPALSNTFIVNEIVELLNSGIDLHIYSNGTPSKNEKEHYKEQLDIIGNRITYITKDKMFRWNDCVENNIPLAHSIVRRKLNATNNPKYISKFEKQSLKRVPMAFSGIIKDLSARKVTKLYSPFGDLGADICMLLGTHMKIPFYFACHSYDLFNMNGYTSLKFKLAKKIFTVSEYNKKWICEKFKIPSRKVVIKRVNFINTNTQTLSKDIGYDYMFSAGRLTDMKGFKYSIAAFIEFNKLYPDMHYIIAGCGVGEEQLLSLITASGMSEKIHLVGYVDNAEVISYIKGSKFTILSSINSKDGDCEGIPTFFIESMANGVPCIGSNYSGIPELIHDRKNGILTELNDVDDILAAMKELYSIVCSDKLESFSRECINTIAQDFDNKKNIEIFIKNSKCKGIRHGNK